MFGFFKKKETSNECEKPVRINYNLCAFSELDPSWDGNRLVLQTFDHSDNIATGFGCCVDYDLIFDRENAEKLFIAVNDKTDGGFKSLCFSDIREFCDKRGIKYTYNSWYDFD